MYMTIAALHTYHKHIVENVVFLLKIGFYR